MATDEARSQVVLARSSIRIQRRIIVDGMPPDFNKSGKRRAAESRSEWTTLEPGSERREMSSFSWTKLVACTGSLVALLFPCGAIANPDLPALYGARSVGMGGTGVSFLEGAAGGVYHNPALLDGVSRLEVDLAVAPFTGVMDVPLAKPATVSPAKQTNSDPVLVPFAMLAAGFRVHERITVGAGGFVSGGVGAKYANQSVLDAAATSADRRDDFDDLNLTVATVEATVPISVRLTDDLSLGLAWRAGYTMSSTTVIVPNPAADGLVSRVKQDVGGSNFWGAAAGARYRVSDALSVGASYRSKMTMKLEGKTDIEANAGPDGNPATLVADADTKSSWSTPHQVRAGASLSLLKHKLLLAFEGRVHLYRDSSQDLNSEIDLNGQPLMGLTMTTTLDTSVKLDWNNSYTGLMGAEYWLFPSWALRAGVSLGNSATPVERPSASVPVPGLLYAGGAGVGGEWEHWSAGVAAWYMRGSKAVSAANVATDSGIPAAPAGTYSGNLFMAALSAGYRL